MLTYVTFKFWNLPLPFSFVTYLRVKNRRQKNTRKHTNTRENTRKHAKNTREHAKTRENTRKHAKTREADGAKLSRSTKQNLHKSNHARHISTWFLKVHNHTNIWKKKETYFFENRRNNEIHFWFITHRLIEILRFSLNPHRMKWPNHKRATAVDLTLSHIVASHVPRRY